MLQLATQRTYGAENSIKGKLGMVNPWLTLQLADDVMRSFGYPQVDLGDSANPNWSQYSPENSG